MQPSRTGQSDVKSAIEDICRIAEPLLRMLDREALEEIFRSDAHPTMKQAMEMRFAQTCSGGEVVQTWLLRMILVQMPNHFCYAVKIIHTTIVFGYRSTDTRFLLSFETTRLAAGKGLLFMEVHRC